MCDFGTFLSQARRDHFVRSLKHEDIQRVLFTEGMRLMFQCAVEKAFAIEAATKRTAAAHAREGAVSDVYKVHVNRGGLTPAGAPGTYKCHAVKSASTAGYFGSSSLSHVSRRCPHIGGYMF